MKWCFQGRRIWYIMDLAFIFSPFPNIKINSSPGERVRRYRNIVSNAPAERKPSDTGRSQRLCQTTIVTLDCPDTLPVLLQLLSISTAFLLVSCLRSAIKQQTNTNKVLWIDQLARTLRRESDSKKKTEKTRGRGHCERLLLRSTTCSRLPHSHTLRSKRQSGLES